MAHAITSQSLSSRILWFDGAKSIAHADPDEALARIAEGYRLVAFSVDMLFLVRPADDGLNRTAA